MRAYDVRPLNLVHNGQPVVEYEPDNPDHQHVVTLFRGCEAYRNYWSVDDLSPELRERLKAVEEP